MAGEYGRGGVAEVGAAQKGSSTSDLYTFKPKTAQEYLTGEQQRAYDEALSILGKAYRGGNKKKIIKSVGALETYNKLREIAAGKAFNEFTAQGMELGKPWRLKAPGGLLSEETMAPSYIPEYAAMRTGIAKGEVGNRSILARREANFGVIGPEDIKQKKLRERVLSQEQYTPTPFGMESRNNPLFKQLWR